MKRLFAVIVVLALVLSLVPAAAMAAEETVSTWSDLKAKLEAGTSVKLGASITAPDGESIKIAKGLTVSLTLNGYDITGKDIGTASFGLITNNGTLTINGTGTITLSATTDRVWNAYSSVVSNACGTLTVNSGVTLDHKGGTSMSYALDNLTNGNIGAASATINGATLKSTYRSIRQFCNSDTLTNSLLINSGTFVGQVWVQGSNTKDNKASLTIKDGSFQPAGQDSSSVYIETEGSDAYSVKVEGGDYATRIGIDDTTNLNGFITGGTFGKEPVAGTVADSYELTENNGKFEVEPEGNEGGAGTAIPETGDADMPVLYGLVALLALAALVLKRRAIA